MEIKLGNLRLSENNVRKENGEAIDELKASILAHGLLHSLVVVKIEDENQYFPEPVYEVVAGNRRLMAMKRLQIEQKMSSEQPITCRVVKREEALELSLAENVQRVAMHPADEFEAFAALILEGKMAEEVAERFGTTERKVRQRMKLANVAPELLQAYRAGEITLKTLEAFTLTSDREKQLQVWKSLGSSSSSAITVRRALTEGEVDAENRIAKFVTLEVYQAAGGKTREDLFGDETYLEDQPLLNRLAGEKLEAAADDVKAEGWSWIDFDFDKPGWHELDKYSQQKGPDYSEKQMKKGGCFVFIGYHGELEIDRGWIRPADAKAIKKEAVSDKASEGVGDLSNVLKQSLADDRLEVIQMAIASKPSIALDLLLVQMLGQAGGDLYFFGPLAVDITQPGRPLDGEDISPARLELAKNAPREIITALHDENRSDVEKLDYVLSLPIKDKLEALAWCVGTTVQGATSGNQSMISAALAYCDVRLAEWWHPTAHNCLLWLKKDQLLALGDELLGGDWLADHHKSKKREIVSDLEAVFAAPTEAASDPETAARIAAWLPEGLDFPAPAVEPAEKKAEAA